MLFELKYEKWLEMADEEELMVGVESREKAFQGALLNAEKQETSY